MPLAVFMLFRSVGQWFVLFIINFIYTAKIDQNILLSLSANSTENGDILRLRKNQSYKKIRKYGRG